MSEQNFLASLLWRYVDDAAEDKSMVENASPLHSTSKTREIFGRSKEGVGGRGKSTIIGNTAHKSCPRHMC